MSERVERARAAGSVGLIFTGDYAFPRARDWGTPFIPPKVDPRTMARYAPEVLRRPRWLASFVRSGHLPDLTAPNMVPRGIRAPTAFGESLAIWSSTPPATWRTSAGSGSNGAALFL